MIPLFKCGPYSIYFWSEEQSPPDPIHVHISKATPLENAPPIWITQAGYCLLSDDCFQIPPNTFRNLTRIVEARSHEICAVWQNHFGTIRYYC